MNETPALEIHIKIRDTVSIQGDKSAVSIVSFGVKASSASFKGKVLSGATDTQIECADGAKTLSQDISSKVLTVREAPAKSS